MSTSAMHRLVKGILVSVVGLTIGLGSAAAYAAAPAPKAPVAAHGSKTRATPAKHQKSKKHTKKHSKKHSKNAKHTKKASHKHARHSTKTPRA